MCFAFFFFFNATPPSELYTLSLHDALPICLPIGVRIPSQSRTAATSPNGTPVCAMQNGPGFIDRKSTRLNSSHVKISYAVFCLKKKKHKKSLHPTRRQLYVHAVVAPVLHLE